MNIIVLLSSGLHPISGAAVLPRIEAQAIRMARELGAVSGLHAGVAASPVSDALGYGLSHIQHLLLEPAADPLAALATALAFAKPALILAGRRSQGGEETGLVPYALSKALGMAIIPDAIALTPGVEPDTLIVDQALPKGAKRRVTVRVPAIVTVHPNAPAPLPFAYGQARRGRIETIAASAAAPAGAPGVTIEERPYRPRPKMMRAAPAGASAQERLKAATGATDAGKANVLVHPEPEVAAQEILAYLRRIGVLRAPVDPSV